MSTIAERIAALSPVKRALFEARLADEARRLATEVRTAPLSFPQQRLWFVEQLEPGSSAYIVPSVLRLTGPLDIVAIHRAFDVVVGRHDVLRTTFPMVDGQPVQRIAPAQPQNVAVIDLAGLPQPAETARAIAGREMRWAVDLASGPLVRLRLFRLGAGDHVLLLLMHHIVCDGWSAGLLERELTVAYTAAAAGREPMLTPLPMQYADFARWQRSRTQSEDRERLLAYWRTQLEGLAPLDLPTDGPRTAKAARPAGAVTWHVGADVSAALGALARAENATLFMVLLAAFQAVLSRYTGQQDIAVGTEVANRSRIELEPLIGFFVNELVLRADLSGNPTVRALVRRVRATTLDAYAHQDMPFDMLVEALAPVRDLGRNPLFQVGFTLDRSDRAQAAAHDPEARAEGIASESFGGRELRADAKFDFVLSADETPRGLFGTVEYAADLFHEGTMRALADAWTHWLTDAVRDPDRGVQEIALVDDRARAELQTIGRGPDPGPEPAAEDVPAAIEAQAVRTPDAVAISWQGGALTFAGLDQRASAVARLLLASGRLDGRGTSRLAEPIVGVAASSSVDYAVGMLAIWKAGAVYLPVPPRLSIDRLRAMTSSASAVAVLTDSGRRDEAANLGVPLIDIDGEPHADRGSACERGVRKRHGAALAYVMFTSGSTGRPKGVAISHEALTTYGRSIRPLLNLRSDDRFMQRAFVGFDVFMEETLGGWLAGAAVVMCGSGERWSIAELEALIAEQQVTAMELTSGLWSAWTIELNRTRRRAPESLRVVMIGSERASALPMDAWDGVELWNSYGLTETAITSTMTRIGRGRLDLPIGPPMPGVQVFVLDRAQRLTPRGAAGELCLGGTIVGRGYVGEPALTAERFVPDPVSGAAGARLYRSGDRVRWRTDGELDFLGRLDAQVKVRGYRIEPGEVEAVLARHPDVRQCVVVSRERTPGDLHLVAYVVPASRAAVKVPVLRAHVNQFVPDYMVPSAWVLLDELPAMPNGKLNARALPAPDWGELAQAALAAPRTPIEAILAGLWAAVLQRTAVGVDQNFFEMGGHSLLATQVMARVRQTCGVDVPLRAIFESPTVATLAPAVETAIRRGDPPLPPLSAVTPRPTRVPLAFAQQRLWFLAQFEPDSAAYHIPAIVPLQGAIDVWALARSFDALETRHESLRTRIVLADDAPMQEVCDPRLRGLPVVDLTRCVAPAAARLTRRLARQDEARPFDLQAGDVWRASLVRLAAQEHVLLVTLHHIVSDAWSAEIMLRELTTLYEAHRTGRDAALPDLPVQYADYALWQRQSLEGERLERQLAYWRRQLAGVTPLILPTDFAPPASPTRAGARLRFAVPGAVADALRAISQREGATLFMVVLAAFQLLLARYTGQDDVTVGTPVANRHHAHAEGVIGCFMNLLVLRTGLPGHATFLALLQRVRTVALEAYAHQDAPFERLVDEFAPDRDGTGASLVPAVFSWIATAPAGAAAAPAAARSAGASVGAGVDSSAGAGAGVGSRVEAASIDNAKYATDRVAADAAADAAAGAAADVMSLENAPPAKFDLTLVVHDGAGTLGGAFEYAAELFAPETVARLLRDFEQLLAAIAKAPERPLEALTTLDDADLRRLLLDWNHVTFEAEEEDACVHERIAVALRRSPDAVAVMDDAQHLTASALAARVGELASRLRTLGVGPDRAVAVYLDRTVHIAIALLAIWEADGVYVPLDPANPPARLGRMLDEARPVVCLTSRARAGDEALAGRGCLVIDDLAAADELRVPGGLGAARAAARGIGRSRREQLAYLMYTSGSTGTPKGVMIPHGAITQFMRALRRRMAFGPADRMLAITTFAFDISLIELLVPLMSGGTVVIGPPDAVYDPEIARALFARVAPTLAQATPTTWRLLVGAGWRPDAQLRLLTGGEALPADLGRTLCAHARGVWNLYGPTEATVYASMLALDAAEQMNRSGISSIGRPMPPHATIFILDRTGQLVPPGVIGELYIGGRGLARGYLGRPTQTADRFLPDPFSNEQGGRLYRTGDRARWSPRGTLEYFGRDDAQVKLLGQRVELGEIESVLREHPEVRDAAVVLAADAAGHPMLAAYVVGPTADGAAALRAFARRRLPRALTPGAIVSLDTLPRTAAGKVDRRALSQLVPAPVETAVAALTPTEDILAGMWAGLLPAPPASADADFFALGAHSLTATQLVSRIRQTFGVALPVRAVFEQPVLRDLARAIERAREAGDRPSAPPIVPAPRTGALPLSFSQERLWFLDQMDPGNSAYNVPLALRLRGTVDRWAVRAALGAIVARHETLRTTFPLVDGAPVQHIAPPPAETPLPLIDLAALPPERRLQAAQQLAAREAERPFSLAEGPLLRALLIRLSPEEQHALLTMHHIVTDGWSLARLSGEFQLLYDAFAAGEVPALTPLAVQYADYAIWQRNWLTGDARDRELGFWIGQLRGLAPLELPTDRPRAAAPTFRGASVESRLSPALTTALRSVSRAEGVTLFMTMLAALQATLGRVAGQDDVAVGVPVANRHHIETEPLIGFFVNTLVLRASLAGDPAFSGLLRDVRATVLDAYAHQDVPFEQLVSELQPQRQLTRTPLFNVQFLFQNMPEASVDLPGVAASSIAVESGKTKFDLSVWVLDRGESLSLVADYQADLFDSDSVRFLLAHYEAILQAAAEDAGRPLSALAPAAAVVSPPSPVPAPSTFQLFEDVAIEQNVARRFFAIAAARPDAVAVCAGESRVTYAALTRQAHAIAEALRARCGSGDARVGLLCEPGAPMIACMLGALAAGVTYVPLDPRYPEARLRFMVADAEMVATLAPGTLIERAKALARVPAIDIDRLDEPEHDAEAAALTALTMLTEASADRTAYILYTSGSTGQPRGVVQNHRNILHFIRGYTNNLRIAAEDRLTLLSSFAFDAAVMDIFGALLNGSSLHLFDVREQGVDALAGWLRREEITIYHSVPTVFRYWLASGSGPYPAVRLVVMGGEETTRADLELYRRELPDHCLFVNGLGPTESTVALQWFADKQTTVSRASAPVGWPVAATEVLLLDPASGQPALAGEIAIRSRHVALGYWRRPELTRAAFLVADDDGTRTYLTGDLGRRLPDGALQFRGRKDGQLKIRGHRVEPVEVEAALEAHRAVSRAVVIARPDRRGELRLCAFVTTIAASSPEHAPGHAPEPRPEQAPGVVDVEVDAHVDAGLTAFALRQYAEERLPDYAVPAIITLVDQLPLTPTGKIDRQALPTPADASGDEPFAAPASPTEELLCGVWCEVLGIDACGALDDFFLRGGHSLLATRVAARVRDLFGVVLPLRTLFQHPTVRALAAQVDALRGRASAAGAGVTPAADAAEAAEAPLSNAQWRLWLEEQLHPGEPTYNLPAALGLDGPLDVAALSQTMGEIVRRHAILRTVIAVDDAGEPTQRIAPADGPYALAVVDLSRLPDAGAVAGRLLRAASLRPFDLARGPLFRACLLRTAARAHVLSVVMHHIVTDGWSLGVLARELDRLYSAFAAGLPSPLPEPRFQFADYARWHRAWLTPERLEQQVAYWRQQLALVPPLRLAAARIPASPSSAPSLASSPFPTSSRAVASGAHHGASLPIVFSPELTKQLRLFSRAEGATLFMTLLAGLQTTLGLTARQTDFAIGTDLSYRTIVESEAMIGFFVNQLVLRADLRGNPTFREIARRARETTLEAYDHPDVPFERLVEELAPVRHPGETPLFQAKLVLQNLPEADVALPAVRIRSQIGLVQVAKFDLTLTLEETGAGLGGLLNYRTALLDDEAMLTLRARLLATFETAMIDPDIPLDRLGVQLAAVRAAAEPVAPPARAAVRRGARRRPVASA